MSNGNGSVSAPMPGVPIVGQPFTLETVMCPINATLRCNCGGAETETRVTISASVAAACAACGKVYNLAFNPTTRNVEMMVGLPTPELVS